MSRYLKAPGLPTRKFDEEHAERLLSMPNNGGWEESTEAEYLKENPIGEEADKSESKSGRKDNRKNPKSGAKGSSNGNDLAE